MQIMNTFVSKIGPSGKRNRAARRKQERIQAYHLSRGHVLSRTEKLINSIQNHREEVAKCASVGAETLQRFNKQVQADLKEAVVPTTLHGFSGTWDATIARKALEMFAKSGKSQRAFSAEHQFPESRLRSWKKKLEG